MCIHIIRGNNIQFLSIVQELNTVLLLLLLFWLCGVSTGSVTATIYPAVLFNVRLTAHPCWRFALFGRQSRPSETFHNVSIKVSMLLECLDRLTVFSVYSLYLICWRNLTISLRMFTSLHSRTSLRLLNLQSKENCILV